MRKFKGLVFVIVLSAAIGRSGDVSAQTLVELQAVPSTWQIQEYFPNQTELFFTGSSCTNGQLQFPSTAVQADQDRLWALILAARASGQSVIVYYWVSGTNCYISTYAAAPTS